MVTPDPVIATTRNTRDPRVARAILLHAVPRVAVTAPPAQAVRAVRVVIPDITLGTVRPQAVRITPVAPVARVAPRDQSATSSTFTAVGTDDTRVRTTTRRANAITTPPVPAHPLRALAIHTRVIPARIPSTMTNTASITTTPQVTVRVLAHPPLLPRAPLLLRALDPIPAAASTHAPSRVAVPALAPVAPVPAAVLARALITTTTARNPLPPPAAVAAVPLLAQALVQAQVLALVAQVLAAQVRVLALAAQVALVALVAHSPAAVAVAPPVKRTLRQESRISCRF